MIESLARRVGRLVSGSMHALVEAVENASPEMVMEQAMREIDGAVEEVRAELGRQLAQKHLASTRLMEENSRHDELSQQLAVAIGQARDDLAEVGIAEQMDIEARIPVLESTIADCLARERELESYLQALQAKRRDMKHQLADYQRQQQERNLPGGSFSAGASTTERRAEAAGSAFERVLENATGVPGRGEPGDARRLAELEELARRNRIAERLAALKAGR